MIKFALCSLFTIYRLSFGRYLLQTITGPNGQECTDNPNACPIDSNGTFTSLSSTQIECQENFDCCTCASITCGSVAGPYCDSFISNGDSSAFYVYPISIIGDPGGDGALIECNGNKSCEGTQIEGRHIKQVECKTDRSCADTEWIISCIRDVGCIMNCEGVQACLGSFTVYNSAGLSCKDHACSNAVFFINSNITKSVECDGTRACQGSVIDIDFVQIIECSDELSCADAVITVTDPVQGFQVQCKGYRSCRGLTLLIDISPSSFLTELKGFECAAEEACKDAIIIIRNQMESTLIVEQLNCDAELACLDATFAVEEVPGQVSFEDCNCGDNGCLGATQSGDGTPIGCIPFETTSTTIATTTPNTPSPTVKTPFPTSPTTETPFPTTPTVKTPFPTSPTIKTPFPTSPTVETPFPTSPTIKTPFPTSPTIKTPFPTSPTIKTPFPTIKTPFPTSPTIKTPFPTSPTAKTPFPTMPTPYPTINTPYPTHPGPNGQHCASSVSSDSRGSSDSDELHSLCPLTSAGDFTSITSTQIECEDDYDCCTCSWIRCGSIGGSYCRQFVANGVSSAFYVSPILIIGDPDNGAVIDCNGARSCQGSEIESMYIQHIKCSGDYSCAFATIMVMDPRDKFVIECSGHNSCQGLRLEVTLPSNSGITEFNGIECRGNEACVDALISVINNSPNTLIIREVNCESWRGCDGASFDLIGSIVFETCICGDNGCLGAHGLDQCFENLDRLQCKESACYGQSAIIINPSNDFEVICDEWRSCTNFDLTVIINEYANDYPVRGIKGVTCSQDMSCEGFTLTILNQQNEITLNVNKIECSGYNSCVLAVFSGNGARNVVFEEIECNGNCGVSGTIQQCIVESGGEQMFCD